MSEIDASEPRIAGYAALSVACWCAVALSLLFVLLPAVDLATAALFYQGGDGFWLRGTPAERFVRQTVRPGLQGLVLVCLALACLSLASRGRLIDWPPRAIGYIVATFLIGPGLLVNGILKTFIGRARPKQIVEFGGDRLFSAAYLPADQCAGNCSFVSGDVAFASATIAFALLARGRKRVVLVWAWFGFVAATGVYRMAVGAHFLSDVVLAALSSVLLALLFRRLFLARATARDTGA